ncbi:hypothetical protein ACQKWADRAFT_611 [Trichoderma austrokoningii]
MPFDSLRAFQQDLSNVLNFPTVKALRFMIQGKCYDGQTASDSASAPTPAKSTKSSKSATSVHRNVTEREKCLIRHGGKCMITGTAHPRVCHILPFAINAKQANITIFEELRGSLNGLLGTDTALHLSLLITSAPGSSDKSWNMLSLHPSLHSFWAKCLFAIKCLGITPLENNTSIIKLQFHWMPKNIRKHNELLKPPYNNTVDEIIQGLAHQDTTPGFSIFKDHSGRELETEKLSILCWRKRMRKR